jgi:heavy metal sensor kinase
MRPVSIRTRTGLLAATGTLFVLALLCLGVYVLLGQALQRQLDANLLARTPVLLDEIGDDLGDYVEVEDELIDEGAGAAQVVRSDGQVIAASGGMSQTTSVLPPAELAGIAPGAAVQRTVRAGGARYRLLATAFPDGTAVLVLAQDLDAVRSAQRALVTTLLPLGLLAVGTTAAVSMLVAGRSLRPLTSMAAEATDIGGDNLSKRLSVPASGDEVERIGTTINGMLERVESALERERSFAADASHELRTPLAILRGEIELARLRADGAIAGRLDSALEEADRLAVLVDDLLLLARAGSERRTLARTDLSELARQTADRFSVIAAAKDIKIHVTGRGHASVDRAYIERALSNLLDNAIRHTPAEGRIDISCETTPAGAVLTVSDTGPGVPDAQLTDIFQRFTRTDDARTAGGAGLGLAIVAAIAAAHDGTVRACNREDGTGLRVELHLPRSEGTAIGAMPR